MKSVVLVALAASASTLALSSAAMAQVDSPSGRLSAPVSVDGFQPTTQGAPEPVTQRRKGDANPAPAVDPWNTPAQPAGIALGNATVFYPGVTAGAYYDDNVFATNSNRRSDWVAFVRPEAALRWAGERATVVAQGYIEDRQHRTYITENQVNGGAALNSLWMPDNDTQVIGRFRYTRAHEDRGSGESELFNGTATPTPTEPIAYDTFQAAGALNRRFGRFWSSTGVANLWVHYQDPLLTDGTISSQEYRNGEIGAVTQRFGYVVAPLTSVFVEWTGNRRDFNTNALNDFDSRGYRAVGGILLEDGPSARVKGEVYAGYMRQEYAGFGFEDISTYTYGGALAFALAPNWTATVLGSREAKESALMNVITATQGVSVIESTAAARLDWRFHPQWLVGGGVSYVEDDFRLGNRVDRSISPLASLKYFINPFVTAGVDYRRVNFGSSGTGVLDYYRNVVMFSINARL